MKTKEEIYQEELERLQACTDQFYKLAIAMVENEIDLGLVISALGMARHKFAGCTRAVTNAKARYDAEQRPR